MATGDCFTVALAVAEDHADEDVRVVHGTPLGTGPENMGERYWHAWVEVTTDVDLAPLGYPGRVHRSTIAYDLSNDKEVAMPVELYYRFGHLEEEHIFRYTLREALGHTLDTGHYGPWADVEAL